MMKRKAPNNAVATHSPLIWGLVAVVGIGFSIPTSSHAISYFTGYPSRSSSYNINLGSTSHYVSRYSSGGVDRQHQQEYKRLQQQMLQEQIRNAKYDENPPCGVYNRLPRQCKRGKTNVAERD